VREPLPQLGPAHVHHLALPDDAPGACRLHEWFCRAEQPGALGQIGLVAEDAQRRLCALAQKPAIPQDHTGRKPRLQAPHSVREVTLLAQDRAQAEVGTSGNV
jgi:hypothetical protein